MVTSPRSCNVCGTINLSQAAFCMTCGEPMEERALSPRNLTGLLLQDQLLKQRYRILGQIGQGGFAAVYKAEDLQFSNRLVAVKEMSQSGLSPKELVNAVEAFKHEALMLASLQHPNLPRIYDHFSERGRWYFVMDFIEGDTLESYLSRQPDSRLSLQETLAIGLQLCSVLDYLHTRRPPIIFRDLKPANILSTPSKHLYLIDFGIARHFKPGQTKDTIAFGSPGYAAPEQYGKAQTTQQSDIYSLGVLLHHLISGEDPSEKPFLLAPLRVYGPEGLVELEHLMTHMTALDPEQRPTSVAEVQAQLQFIATQSAENRIRSQIQRPSRHEERPIEWSEERSAARQEQVLLPPESRSRRRFIIGGLLAGTVLAIGAGIFAVLPRSHTQLAHPATGPSIEDHQATVPTTVHTVPDVMFGFNAQHTRFNSYEKILSPANVSRLTLAWRSQGIGGNDFSSPVVSGGLVYVGSFDGRLYAFDAVTGKMRWISNPYSAIGSPGSVDSTPAVVNGVVYVCLQDSKLHAFAADTGTSRWVAPVDNTLTSAPTVSNGVIYAASGDSVYAFDAASGKTLWISSPMDSISYSSPAVANGLISVGTFGKSPETGQVYAFDAVSGKMRWNSGPIQIGIDGNSAPTVANGRVYIAAGNGGVAAFDALTGHHLWVTTEPGGTTGFSPAVANGLVYASNDRISAFEEDTGNLRWVTDAIGAYDVDSPLVANGVLYVCSTNSSVYALNADTGRVLWTSPPTAGQLFSTPAVANGMLYLASEDKDGNVYAYHLP
jgi:serine/threonine protein kinase